MKKPVPSRHPSHLPLKLWAAGRDFGDGKPEGAFSSGEESPRAKTADAASALLRKGATGHAAATSRPRALLNLDLKNAPHPTDAFVRGDGI